MTGRYLWIVLTLVGIADDERQIGHIGFAKDYPRSSTDRGAIEVKGTAQAYKDWRLEGKVLLEVWANDCQARTFEVEITNGTWGPVSIRGLTSSEEYNVVLVLPLKSGEKRGAIASAPGRATAR